MSQTAAHNVAFIFDCDGTLVNSTPVWAYAQPELLHRHGVDVTVDDFAQFEHLSLEDECQAYHDTWGIGANGEELYRELSNILIDGYSKVPPRDGLLAFLEQAKAAGIAMCVATSTPAELVQSALAGAGLDAYMEFVTTTGEAAQVLHCWRVKWFLHRKKPWRKLRTGLQNGGPTILPGWHWLFRVSRTNISTLR